jgi:hypothetical protein
MHQATSFRFGPASPSPLRCATFLSCTFRSTPAIPVLCQPSSECHLHSDRTGRKIPSLQFRANAVLDGQLPNMTSTQSLATPATPRQWPTRFDTHRLNLPRPSAPAEPCLFDAGQAAPHPPGLDETCHACHDFAVLNGPNRIYPRLRFHNRPVPNMTYSPVPACDSLAARSAACLFLTDRACDYLPVPNDPTTASPGLHFHARNSQVPGLPLLVPAHPKRSMPAMPCQC